MNLAQNWHLLIQKNLCFALKFDADQIICKVARYDVKRLI